MAAAGTLDPEGLQLTFEDGCVVINDTEYWYPADQTIANVGDLIAFLETQEDFKGKKITPYSARNRKIMTKEAAANTIAYIKLEDPAAASPALSPRTLPPPANASGKAPARALPTTIPTAASSPTAARPLPSATSGASPRTLPSALPPAVAKKSATSPALPHATPATAAAAPASVPPASSSPATSVSSSLAARLAEQKRKEREQKEKEQKDLGELLTEVKAAPLPKVGAAGSTPTAAQRWDQKIDPSKFPALAKMLPHKVGGTSPASAAAASPSSAAPKLASSASTSALAEAIARRKEQEKLMPKEPPKREVNPLLAAELASMQQGLRKVERKEKEFGQEEDSTSDALSELDSLVEDTKRDRSSLSPRPSSTSSAYSSNASSAKYPKSNSSYSTSSGGGGGGGSDDFAPFLAQVRGEAPPPSDDSKDAISDLDDLLREETSSKSRSGSTLTREEELTMEEEAILREQEKLRRELAILSADADSILTKPASSSRGSDPYSSEFSDSKLDDTDDRKLDDETDDLDKKLCLTCYGLVEPEQEADAVNACNRLWHKECWKCSICGKSLVGDQFGFDSNQVYCEADFKAKFFCAVCGELVDDDVDEVHADGKIYHPDCYENKATKTKKKDMEEDEEAFRSWVESFNSQLATNEKKKQESPSPPSSTPPSGQVPLPQLPLPQQPPPAAKAAAGTKPLPLLPPLKTNPPNQTGWTAGWPGQAAAAAAAAVAAATPPASAALSSPIAALPGAVVPPSTGTFNGPSHLKLMPLKPAPPATPKVFQIDPTTPSQYTFRIINKIPQPGSKEMAYQIKIFDAKQAGVSGELIRTYKELKALGEALSKTYKLKLYPVPKPKKNQLLAEEMSVLEGWLNYVGRQEGIYSTETFKYFLELGGGIDVLSKSGPLSIGAPMNIRHLGHAGPNDVALLQRK